MFDKKPSPTPAPAPKPLPPSQSAQAKSTQLAKPNQAPSSVTARPAQRQTSPWHAAQLPRGTAQSGHAAQPRPGTVGLEQSSSIKPPFKVSQIARPQLRVGAPRSLPKPLTKPPGYVPKQNSSGLDSTQMLKAKSWYATNAAYYTPAVIKQIQQAIGSPVTGKVTTKFLTDAANWQLTFDLQGKTGKFTTLPNGDMVQGFAETGVIGPDQLASLMPTGLAKDKTIEKYAAQLLDIKKNWTNYDTPAERQKGVQQLLSQLSEASSTPQMQLRFQKLQEQTEGSFNHKSWTMVLNSAHLNDPKMTPDKFVDIMETVYHESRHAEQNFMSARFLAGQNLTAAQVKDNMDLPVGIAKKAVESPIASSTIQGIVAQGFYDSKFGSHKKETDNVYKNLNGPYYAKLNAKNQLEYWNKILDDLNKGLALAQSDKKKNLQKSIEDTKTHILKYQRVIDNFPAEDAKAYSKYRALRGEEDAFRVEDRLHHSFIKMHDNQGP